MWLFPSCEQPAALRPFHFHSNPCHHPNTNHVASPHPPPSCGFTSTPPPLTSRLSPQPPGGATGFLIGGYSYLRSPPDPALSSLKLRANRLINMSGSLGRRFACASAILGLYFACFESYVFSTVDGRLPDAACTAIAGGVGAAWGSVHAGGWVGFCVGVLMEGCQRTCMHVRAWHVRQELCV